MLISKRGRHETYDRSEPVYVVVPREIGACDSRSETSRRVETGAGEREASHHCDKKRETNSNGRHECGVVFLRGQHQYRENEE
jgi:hypothetical protein